MISTVEEIQKKWDLLDMLEAIAVGQNLAASEMEDSAGARRGC